MMIDRSHNLSHGAPALPVLFVASVLVFPRTFVEVKLALLALILTHLGISARSHTTAVLRRIGPFYASFVIVGLLAASVGTLRDNPPEAISDGIRLYVFWSLLIPAILVYLHQFDTTLVIHYGVLLGAFSISAIDITFVVGSYLGFSVFPEWVNEALLLKVGFHDGYIQLIAHNVGMLLFIVPYLLVTVLRTDGRRERRWLVWLALGATLLTAAISGRRGLWLTIALVPYLMWMLSIATRTQKRIKSYSWFCCIASGGLIFAALFPKLFLSEDTFSYLVSAFSEEDERSIQKVYLLRAFQETPFFGSGFGGIAEYIRSVEFPWSYELSYHVMLFNFGLVGFAILVTAFIVTYINATRAVSQQCQHMPYGAAAILIGTTSLLVGSYSNPYLGSFDYLFVVGFLHLVALQAPGGLPRSAPMGQESAMGIRQRNA